MNIENRPSLIRPSKHVADFSKCLPTSESLNVLDAGACEGRNSVYLAKLGHKVVALTNNHQEALIGAQVARRQEMKQGGSCQFVTGDVRKLMFASVFDVVLANEVLHLMSKPQSTETLEALRDITNPGGTHVVSGYVVNSWEANERNRSRCFRPNELIESYKIAGWQVVDYCEDPSSTQDINGQQYINSLAKIIAVRRS